MVRDKMKVIVASDSFKGSLSSLEVAAAAAEGIAKVAPGAEVVEVGVADGGEGTAETLVASLGGRRVVCRVEDPLGRQIDASYGIAEADGENVALIDMASASGLTLLAPDERNPLVTTTFGTGQLIVDGFEHGCRRFVVGIGGSATCDGGEGMLRALGFRFLDAEGVEIAPGGGGLDRLARIDMSGVREDILRCRFTVICDVNNPLCGPEGAAAVFGPQKGATPADVETLERGLRRWADVVRRQTGRDVAVMPGAGAAGGLGAAFMAFFNSELKPGVDAVLDLVGFDCLLRGASLVITGEGKMDRQTLFGKLPLGVLRRASSAGVPAVAIAGMVENAADLLDAGFAGVFSVMNRVMTLDEAMDSRNASANVAATAASIVKMYVSLKN